jgi:hypothetical protein
MSGVGFSFGQCRFAFADHRPWFPCSPSQYRERSQEKRPDTDGGPDDHSGSYPIDGVSCVQANGQVTPMGSSFGAFFVAFNGKSPFGSAPLANEDSHAKAFDS